MTTAKTTAAASKTTPVKAPSVRTRKAPADRAVRFENTPAGKLMKKFSDIPLWEQGPIFDLYEELRDIEKRSEGLSEDEASRLYITTMIKVSKELRSFAVDEKAYDVYISGADALLRAGELSNAWLGQLGK